jgi:hypothetical protein
MCRFTMVPNWVPFPSGGRERNQCRRLCRRTNLREGFSGWDLSGPLRPVGAFESQTRKPTLLGAKMWT